MSAEASADGKVCWRRTASALLWSTKI